MTQTVEQRQRTAGEALRWSAALLTAAAAAIHFAVTPEHFDEDWAFGVFFATAAWAQLLWALLVTRSEHRRLLYAGAIANLAIAVVWVVSRTTGVPVGPEPGAPETVGFVDVIATVWEVLAAVAVLLVPRVRLTLPGRRVAALITALAIFVVPLTTGAIASDSGHASTSNNDGRTDEPSPHGQ